MKTVFNVADRAELGRRLDALAAGALKGLIETFGARAGSPRWAEHPAFGPLTERDWGVLGYKHIDHHLRQFGA